MKRMLGVFLSLVVALSILTRVPIPVSATGVDDLIFELNEDGESYSVIDCNTSAEVALVIPNKYKGLPVTRIGDEAFFWCTDLTSITIPDSVTSIGSSAFLGCTSLTSITIPDSVTSIDMYAFNDCTSLTSIKIPDSVTSISQSTFSNCESLMSVIIPDSITNMEAFVFSNCTSLTSVVIPDSVTSIGSFAFFGCTSLTSITIPDSVTNIGDSFINTGYYNNETNWEDGVLYIGNHLIAAYKYDTRLYEYVGNVEGDCTIKQGTITIADCAFYNCTNLTSVTIPDSVTNMGASVFGNCTSLTSIVIPNSIKTIESYAFRGCTNLISVTIPDSVTNIGWCSFDCCTSLKSITIPASVTSIDYGAFGYCPAEFEPNKIEDFVIYGTVGSEAQNYASENGFKFIDPNHTHTSSSWITDEKATCTKVGSKHKECIECKEIIETATIAKKKHTAGSWKTEKKATVNSAGKKVKKCTECGKTLDTAKIAQLKCSKPKLKTIENTSSGVKITWGKVSGADKYYVYRKTGSGGKYSKIATTTRTYYTDKKVSSGKKYYYYVKAVNEAGSSSASSSKSIVYLADTTLKTPSSTKKGVVLKWSKVSGADGYMVYRKTGSGSYSKIATVKGYSKATYTDQKAKKGKTYTYKVKAYKSKTYSAYSNAKKIKDKY